MQLEQILCWLALLGSALMSGCFFAFSSFVMESLARRPDPEGIAAMQSINEVVLGRSFLGIFLGTAALSAVMALWALLAWSRPQAPLWLSGALCYLIGTFLVTAAGNVPLNQALARQQHRDAAAQPVWRRYQERWTRWNHLRTACSLTATALYALALLQGAHQTRPQENARLRPPLSSLLLDQLPTAPQALKRMPALALSLP